MSEHPAPDQPPPGGAFPPAVPGKTPKAQASGAVPKPRSRWHVLRTRVRLGLTRPVHHRWLALRPPQQLVVGFAVYMLAGTLLLMLPWATRGSSSWLDHLFTAVSAVSTTGLVTVPIGATYTFFGELVVVLLFQVGGVGYMTVSSFLLLSRGRDLGRTREGILGAGFALPRYFDVRRFVRQVVAFTLAIELVGVALLYPMFAMAGEERPLWSAIFHTVSAFCTAGFSLHGDSLERYVDHTGVNLVIMALCLLGSGGFIVMQDVWYSIRFRERMVTFTSKVILTVMLGGVGLSMVLLLLDPLISARSPGDAVLAALFQSVTAMTTAGFNTVPIGGLAPAATIVVVLLMVIGASPSGTGGGLKTTTLSALLACMVSVLRGRDRVTLLGNEIPPARVLTAAAAATLYLTVVVAAIIASTAVEDQPVQWLVFEVVSALGTVGLSMGATGELSSAGKLILIVVMFVGRLGPLTLGLALLRPQPKVENVTVDDLAV